MFEANKNYKVKAVDAGLEQTKGGSAQPTIKFATESGDTITWYGNLNGSTQEKRDKAAEISIEALVAAGFQGNDWEDLKKPFAMMFPSPKVVTIKVIEHVYNGKKSLRVKGVYSESKRQQFTGQAPKMAAAFAKARQTAGVTVTKAQDDAPF